MIKIFVLIVTKGGISLSSKISHTHNLPSTTELKVHILYWNTRRGPQSANPLILQLGVRESGSKG